jgi:hypothetical protein
VRATPNAWGRNCICTETYGQQVSLFLCQLASEFSELASRLSDFGLIEVDLSKCRVDRFEVSMESLILAQDERWRRA